MNKPRRAGLNGQGLDHAWTGGFIRGAHVVALDDATPGRKALYPRGHEVVEFGGDTIAENNAPKAVGIVRVVDGATSMKVEKKVVHADAVPKERKKDIALRVGFEDDVRPETAHAFRAGQGRSRLRHSRRSKRVEPTVWSWANSVRSARQTRAGCTFSSEPLGLRVAIQRSSSTGVVGSTTVAVERSGRIDADAGEVLTQRPLGQTLGQTW